MKTASKKNKKKARKYMSAELFGELTESLTQALQHARGERTDLRTTTRAALPPPPKQMSQKQIVGLRRRLNYSQAVFARVLNVSTKTVQAWEQGAREPSDAALKLLSIADKHPEVLVDA